MKKLLFIIFVSIAFNLSAINYYVSSTGNDANSGLTEALSWKTIAKINGKTFLPGDQILFKRGDTWRETLKVPSSGTEASYLKFGAYGTGVNPRLIGSIQVTGWTQSSTNIWKSNNTFTDITSGSQPSGIWIEKNGAVLWGIYKTSPNAENQWYQSGGYIYIYSASMPGIIEVSQRDFCIDFNRKQYLQFDGINVFYSRWSGYGEDVNSYNQSEHFGALIENCEIGFIGSPMVYNNVDDVGYGTELAYSNMTFRNLKIHDCGRRGVSLHIYGNGFTARNILIEKCEMFNGFHTTGVDISVGSGYTASIDNLTIRQNIIYEVLNRPEASELIFIQNYVSGASIGQVYIYSNVFRYPNGYGILTEGVKGSVNIYNNVFYGFNYNAQAHISIQGNGQSSHAIIENNIFYSSGSTSETAIETYGGQNASYITVSNNLFYNVGSAFGKGTNSITADPLFQSSTDYSLKPGSPAIGMGLYVADALIDFNGTLYGIPRNIGAYSGLSTGLSDVYYKGYFIYPNPAVNKITIVGENITRVEVITLNGNVILDESVNNNEVYFDLRPGIFLIRVNNKLTKLIVL